MASPAPVESVHHVGMTVASLEAALAFWEAFLGRPARWTTVLDRPYLSRVVGYPDVAIKAAFVDLPGGVVLELLDYHQVAGRSANPQATANPGNMHLCLKVADAHAACVRIERRECEQHGAEAVQEVQRDARDAPQPAQRARGQRTRAMHGVTTAPRRTPRDSAARRGRRRSRDSARRGMRS